MSNTDFDPYHEWLRIPPDEQPANHYRLLGLELFEADRDMIESVSLEQIAHVRTFAIGCATGCGGKEVESGRKKWLSTLRVMNEPPQALCQNWFLTGYEIKHHPTQCKHKSN